MSPGPARKGEKVWCTILIFITQFIKDTDRKWWLLCRLFLLLNIFILCFDPGRLRDYWPSGIYWSNRSKGKSSSLYYFSLTNITWTMIPSTDAVECRLRNVLEGCMFLKLVCYCCLCYVTTPLLCCACHVFHLCLLEAAQRCLIVLWRDVRRNGKGFFFHQRNEKGERAIKHKTASALAVKSQHEWFVRVDMRESGTNPSLGQDWSMNSPGEMQDE